MTTSQLYLLKSEWEQTVPKRMQTNIVEHGHQIPSLKNHKGWEKYVDLTLRLQTAMREVIARQIDEEDRKAKERARLASQKRIQKENATTQKEKINKGLFFFFTGGLFIVFTYLNFHNILWLLGAERVEMIVKAPFFIFAVIIAFAPYFFVLNKEIPKLKFSALALGVEMLIYIINLHWPSLKGQTVYLAFYSLYYAVYTFVMGYSLLVTFTKNNK